MKFILPKEIFDQHIIALGKTGAGKSSAVRLIVEHLLDERERVIIITAKGDWWGLKLAADGKHPGYSVPVFGGEHQDMPLHHLSGKAIAELLGTGNRSAILQMRDFMPDERTTFWIDFASTLFRVLRGKLFLVIDEVHNFAPKGKVQDPKAGKMLHWSNKLAAEARGLGITLIGASQRAAKVHNDFLTSCETLIAMRVTTHWDREAVESWIEGCGDENSGTDVLNSLAQMKRGDAWVWSPEVEFGPKQIHFPMFKTYDSFKPQAPVDVKKLKGWAEVDLAEVRDKLALVVKEAEANDPVKLKARIRELEIQARQKQTATKEVKVYDPKEISQAVIAATKSYRKILADNSVAFKDIASFAEKIGLIAARKNQQANYSSKTAEEIISETNDTLRRSPAVLQSAAQAIGKSEKVFDEVERKYRVSESNGKLRAGAERMLSVLAQWSPNGMSKGMMRSHAGLKKSGTVAAYMSDLRNGGYIEERGNEFFATQTGLEYCKHVPAAPSTTEEVLAVWEPKLRDGARRMLRVLVGRHGQSISKEELGEAASLSKSGTFSAYLSDLKTARLVTVNQDGTVAANKESLFL